ncbi:FapA family protein [Shewanella sp.]|uniref:FapA family protein n=1 Tax=Shewanella sp. TaxID=50422 RepID=UPI003569C3CB
MLAPELLELSADGTKAELKLTPAEHGPVTETDLRELLLLPGFTDFCPLDAVIQKAVISINKLCASEDGKFEQFFAIAERRDGKVEILVSPDRMQAEMEITAAYGGKQIVITDVLPALKAEGVSMGLSKVRIEQLLQQIPLLKPGASVKQVIAIGKQAINGENAILERKVALARERLLQPQEREDGTVDMRNLGSVITVKANDVLMVKIPATEGIAGFTVKGEALQPKPGKDIALVPGEGTAISPKDPNRLIATVAGQPVETRTGMQVDDILQIKEVDVKYGHVNFKGSVLITGDVHEGMHVKASGDITVMGFVDSALLEAEGDIIVSKGVIGRQLAEGKHSTVLKAKGQIAAQFVQYSDLIAEGDIQVTKQLLHSHSQTSGKLIVSDNNSRRGDLIGGQAHAAKGVRAVVIGATAGTKTEVYCAMDFSDLRAELKALDESVKAMVVACLDIDARIRKLPPKSEWQDDPVMLEQVKMMMDEKKRMSDERTREELEHDTVKQEVDNYYNNYRIEVIKHIFANVEIHIGQAFNRTQREHGPCVVTNQGQEISFDYSAKP